jgi:hypothetical protein
MPCCDRIVAFKEAFRVAFAWRSHGLAGQTMGYPAVTSVPLVRTGNVRHRHGVGRYVGNDIGYAFVGDDQEEKAMTRTLTPPPETVAAPDAEERCDRCSAAGKLRVVTAGGGELVFCGHHANKYAEDLAKIAVQFAADPDFEWRGAELTAK